MSSTVTFNRAQLATWDEAREVARLLSAGPVTVGDGVKPETRDPKTSGIYTPLWLPGPASFDEPHFHDDRTGKDYFYLHFRFSNGAEGMNVGLILDQLRRYPTSPGFVMRRLAEEAEMLAGK